MKLTLQLVCCILIWECVFASRLSKLTLEPVCSLKPETGLCKARLERFYYDSDEGKCKSFDYGGCEGNGNNFQDEEDCLKVCTPKATEPTKKLSVNVDICSLPRVRGPCDASIERYYYNTKTRLCQQFLYGGCQGNDNNFKTLEDCKVKCVDTPKIDLKLHPYIVETELSKLTLEPVCSLKPETGLCKARLERFYYDSDEGKCKSFDYGGCEGNGNNFQDEEDCLKVCTPKATEPTKKLSADVDICTLPRVRGPCEASIERYYYNTKTRLCQQFLYGGCQGNDNNFKTLEACKTKCVKTTYPKIEKVEPLTDLELEIKPHIVKVKIEKIEPLTDLELKIQPDIVETKIENIEPLTDFKLQPRLVHYKIEPLEKETQRRAEVRTYLDESEYEPIAMNQ